ncbi:MAG: urease accessory protein UreE [Gammaproteobacteria bacterium]|nr:urease accessory protein UreE [Gammaproteobacteria bacterium]
MYLFNQLTSGPAEVNVTLHLTYEQRQRSLLRVRTEDDIDVGIKLNRGELPEVGCLLQSASGEIAQVQAAPESVSVSCTDDMLLFSRACYHLGNRHVKLQIEPGRLCYLHDHVLDEMLVQLGLKVEHAMAAFCPESGAYAGGHAHHHH